MTSPSRYPSISALELRQELAGCPGGRDVTASPALAVRDTGAAALLGVSPGLLRKWRLADRAAVALGRAPQGPPWRSLGGAVVYAVDELQAWLKRQPLGAVAP